MKPYIKVYHNFRFDSGYKYNDLSDDLLGFNIEDDDGKLVTGEFLLINDDNKYGKGGSNELTPGEFIYLQAGWEYDEFGEEDYPAWGTDNVNMGHWPFIGEILEVKDEGPYEKLVLCGGAVDHTANRRFPDCEKSYRTRITINDFLKGAGNEDESFPAVPLASGIAYLFESKFWQSGFPFNDQSNSTQNLDVSGFVKGYYSGMGFSAINVNLSESLHKVFNKLARGIGYICQFRIEKTATAVYPRLFFYPKYYYGDFHPYGTKTTYDSLEDLFTAMETGEGSQWAKKHKFKYSKDSPSGSWSGFLDHDITLTAKRKVERVVIYGKSTLGIVGVAGKQAGYRTEMAINDSDLVDTDLAILEAQILYDRLKDLTKEGTIEADFNWRIKRGDPVQVYDSRSGWTGSDVLYLQVVGFTHIYSAGEDYTTEIKVGSIESIMDLADNLSRVNYEVKSQSLFLPSDSVKRCPLINDDYDEMEMEDETYAVEAPYSYSSSTGSGDKEVDMEWQQSCTRLDSTLEELTFDGYIIYYREGAPPTVPPSRNGALADGYFDKTTDSELGDVETEDITVTMPKSTQSYLFQLVAVFSLGSLEIRIICDYDECISGSPPP